MASESHLLGTYGNLWEPEINIIDFGEAFRIRFARAQAIEGFVHEANGHLKCGTTCWHEIWVPRSLPVCQVDPNSTSMPNLQYHSPFGLTFSQDPPKYLHRYRQAFWIPLKPSKTRENQTNKGWVSRQWFFLRRVLFRLRIRCVIWHGTSWGCKKSRLYVIIYVSMCASSCHVHVLCACCLMYYDVMQCDSMWWNAMLCRAMYARAYVCNAM